MNKSKKNTVMKKEDFKRYFEPTFIIRNNKIFDENGNDAGNISMMIKENFDLLHIVENYEQIKSSLSPYSNWNKIINEYLKVFKDKITDKISEEMKDNIHNSKFISNAAKFFTELNDYINTHVEIKTLPEEIDLGNNFNYLNNPAYLLYINYDKENDFDSVVAIKKGKLSELEVTKDVIKYRFIDNKTGDFLLDFNSVIGFNKEEKYFRDGIISETIFITHDKEEAERYFNISKDKQNLLLEIKKEKLNKDIEEVNNLIFKM